MSNTDHDDRCPLHAVDRRLDDLHRQWHQAEAAYFDPEGFRVAIQTAIQTSRTVTFILQSNKRLIPDFDAWYARWVEQMKASPLMRWMIVARNQIEKVGDLETHSWVRASVIASHLDEGPRVDVPANLFDGPRVILGQIPNDALGDHIKRDGILRLERRWVADTLPEHELLDAVAVTYGMLATIVADAHRQIGKPEPTIRTEDGELPYDRAMAGGRMPCMIGHQEQRALDIWLATGEPLVVASRHFPINEEEAEADAERYGIDPNRMFDADQNMQGQARVLFEHARRLFLADGHHVTLVMIFQQGKPIDMRQLAILEHGEKYLMMRDIGNRVLQMGGDSLIMISELWLGAYDPANPYRRAVDSPNRKEALGLTLISREGEPLYLQAVICRNEEGVQLEETTEHEGGQHYAFAPVYAAWGREMTPDPRHDHGDAI